MIVDLATYRRTRRIVERIPIQYDDVRVEFARQVEERAYELFERQMGNTKPGDTE